MERLRSFAALGMAGICSVSESHFAIVQQDNTDQCNTKWPEAGQDVSRLILGGQAKFQPARPSRGHSQNRERNVAYLGAYFFLEVSEVMGIGVEQCAGYTDLYGKDQSGSAGDDAARL